MPTTHAGSRPAGQPRSLALTEFAHPAGFVSPLHVHHDEHEAFYILEGTAEVHCADEVFRVTPGAASCSCRRGCRIGTR